MIPWLLAVAVGLVLAALAYAGRAGARRAPLGVLAAALRALAAALIVALLLDAPAGKARPPRPLVALDVSASWSRGSDAGWRQARADAERLAGGELLLLGDSARIGEPPESPTDLASAARPAVERALATGRPLILHTDGELDDAQLLDRLPEGSEIRVAAVDAVPDLAAVALDAPSAAVGGDTIVLRARVAAGAAGAGAGELRLALDDAPLAAAPIDALEAHGERTVELSAVMPRREGSALLRLVAAAGDDREARNDTVTVVVELSTVSGVTVVSTAPDFDVRYMLDVLRGTVSLPSRAYFQVAPGRWRQEGSLAPVGEETVREAARRAPILVLHGDTAFLGTARGSGALLLYPAPAVGEAEWYAVAAPPSPRGGALSGVRWDSLPPVAVGTRPPTGEWIGLVARRGRGEERQPLVAGREEPRRRAIVAAGGLWRWRFREGASRTAFDALWGGLFDWLAAERRDQRAALPDHALLRAGEPVRWRRGGSDSVVAVTLHRRGSAAGATAAAGGDDAASVADSIALELRFPSGASVATTSPLAPGVYDVRLADGGTAVLAVNASRELLPRRATVAAGPVGRAPAAAGIAPTVRSLPWLYVLVALLLCAEWLVRRRVGMR